MDDDRDLPPLPIPPPQGQIAESSRRHSHRSKDRQSARDLAALLVLEQREHRETQRELLRVTEQFRTATVRADEARSQVLEATERLKSVNEARFYLSLRLMMILNMVLRLVAVREAARANESLALYKFQLETAQNEIHRAQSVFNIVEKERYRAELSGAKSRTAARKLHEQHKIHLAREEGRRMGLQEGLEAGRINLYELGGGPTPSFEENQIDEYDTDLEYEGLDSPGDYATTEELYSSPPPRNTAPVLAEANSRGTPAPVPVPPPMSTQPVPASTVGPLSPLLAFRDIHPTPVHNAAPHPRQNHFDVPPDGFIPETGPDSLPQIPPPHELSPQIEPPRTIHSVVEEHVIPPSAFARAASSHQHNSPSQRAASVAAESVRRPPSATGPVHPIQMPTPHLNTNIPGMEREAQRSSWSSDIHGGGPAQPSISSGPIPISVMPPSQPDSRTSSFHVPSPSMGSNLFGAGMPSPRARGSPLSPLQIPTQGGPENPPTVQVGAIPPGFVPLGFQASPDVNATRGNSSPMPGGYDLPLEEPVGASYDPYNASDSPSTHSSDMQTSTPNTLTTPPETRRPHPHKPPRVKNPDAWPREPGYVRPTKKAAGPGYGYDRPQGSTSGS
ncbi:hypothetical protein B0H15DRAFT_525007 [Mycena belliarum]|uniref:Uncharacterized protein n=1 Tax=Mycena belliarum TaxID=1033014 RepID=A0AAD6XPJ2_9AGAR|nr:hypothetical protein B0H15DRAFT_525007 [Mycena belliae]